MTPFSIQPSLISFGHFKTKTIEKREKTAQRKERRQEGRHNKAATKLLSQPQLTHLQICRDIIQRVTPTAASSIKKWREIISCCRRDPGPTLTTQLQHELALQRKLHQLRREYTQLHTQLPDKASPVGKVYDFILRSINFVARHNFKMLSLTDFKKKDPFAGQTALGQLLSVAKNAETPEAALRILRAIARSKPEELKDEPLLALFANKHYRRLFMEHYYTGPASLNSFIL